MTCCACSFLSTNRAVFSHAVSFLLLLLLNKEGPLVGCTVMMLEDGGCIMCFVFCRAVAPITPLRPDPLFTERSWMRPWKDGYGMWYYVAHTECMATQLITDQMLITASATGTLKKSSTIKWREKNSKKKKKKFCCLQIYSKQRICSLLLSLKK